MIFKNKILKSLYGKNELIKISDDFFPVDNLLGEGKKGVLIVIRGSDSREEEIGLLTKIFKAVGIKTEVDAFILKVKLKTRLSVSEMRGKVEFNQIFFFGVHPKVLGFNLTCPKYRPIDWSGFRILTADRLAEIGTDEKLKRQLWNALKNWQ